MSLYPVSFSTVRKYIDDELACRRALRGAFVDDVCCLDARCSPKTVHTNRVDDFVHSLEDGVLCLDVLDLLGKDVQVRECESRFSASVGVWNRVGLDRDVSVVDVMQVQSERVHIILWKLDYLVFRLFSSAEHRPLEERRSRGEGPSVDNKRLVIGLGANVNAYYLAEAVRC